MPDAFVTAPIAIIPDESRQVALAGPSQLIATGPVNLAAATPIVAAITPQAISIAQNAPVASLPDMLQDSLSQIDFAEENASALVLFAANFSPPVSSNPVSIATTAAAIGSVASTTTAYSARALADLHTSTAASGSDALGRSAVHAAVDAALEDGSNPIFACDDSLFDLIASEPLKS